MKKGTGLFDVNALVAQRCATLLEHLFVRLCPRKFTPVILDSTDMLAQELFAEHTGTFMRIFEELGLRSQYKLT